MHRLGEFVASVRPPARARAAAAAAVLDTAGVMIAGAAEPASRIVQETIATEMPGACHVVGHPLTASPGGAALANGTAAHALDFDDMCFVSLAHPSAALVPAAFAAGEAAGAAGSVLLDAYVVGFEVEACLGRAMQPRHYDRGWHPTSTIGSVGAAAAACRVLGLDAHRTAQALAIAVSEACGLKENFGTMTKPLHAGLAARNGVLAARLAQAGLSASDRAIDGPQGFLRAGDGARPTLDGLADLGSRWEILETGITVKLYPSCAGTHPTIDTVLDLCREGRISADDIDHIDVGVDAVTPTVLIHDTPATGLEAKFSMPFCVAAAVVHQRVGLDAFNADGLEDSRVAAVMPRVRMTVDDGLGPAAPPLTRARVTLTLRDGRILSRLARGARGYPAAPATPGDLDDKFRTCAARVLGRAAAERALSAFRDFDAAENVSALLALTVPSAVPTRA